MEVRNTIQEAVIKTVPKKKKWKKAKWLSEEGLKIAEKRREAKGKGEKERCIHLNAEFQRIARRDKKVFLIFLIGSFIFLVLSCMSCLYIFEINSLSVASFAIIFSHSEACLFTLLIVSFTVQKLLSLIRSHLLIFAFISITLGGGS